MRWCSHDYAGIGTFARISGIVTYYVSIRKLLKNRILSVCGRVAYPKGAKPHTLKMRPPPEFSERFYMVQPGDYLNAKNPETL
jgi:hypothetical protein